MTDSQQDMQKQEACATAPDGDAPKKVNVALRVYGVLMMLMGILDMVVFLFIGALLGLALYFSTMSPELAGMFNALLAEALGDQTTLAMALMALSAVLTLVGAVFSIRVGYALLRSRRRTVATRVRVLIVVSVLELIGAVMIGGVNASLAPSVIKLAILVALSVRIDPTLAAERKDARRAEQLENEQDAAAGMDGREVREHDDRAAELHTPGQRAEGDHERGGRRRRARGGREHRRRGHDCDGGHGNSRDGHRLATEGQGRRGPSGSTPDGPLSYGATARLQVVDLG